MNYYNEHDPKAAAWLRELIASGEIPKGDVDERSITEIKPTELETYVQCHFFAGIGGWCLALRLSSWPDERPVWTGSCPCQPLSCAGEQRGHADERHLWPAFYSLIAKCRPAIVFGEQVASKDGREWFAGIRADLEGMGYACGCADLCAAGVGAPHIRQRLYWVADASEAGRRKGTKRRDEFDRQNGGWKEAPGGRSVCRAPLIGMANTDSGNGFWGSGPLQVGRNSLAGEIERSGRKYRAQWRVKPGLSLLADGIPGRVAQLCGFGNAIVPQVAAQFIQACEEAMTDL